MNLKQTLIIGSAICCTSIFMAPATMAESKKTDKKEQKATVVTVKQGDTLTKIADKHKTTYVTLFNANKKLKNPDVLNVGDKIRIPKKNEKLENRFSKFQQQIAQVAVSAPAATYQPQQAAQSYSYSAPAAQQSNYNYNGAPAIQGSTAGNTYYSGYCTWYAKNKRPDLPNMLGNGGQWAGNAAAQGFSTGSQPKVGAIMETPGHVAYVEAVNSDGTVTISEMNGTAGFGNVGTRKVSASKGHYIY